VLKLLPNKPPSVGKDSKKIHLQHTKTIYYIIQMGNATEFWWVSSILYIAFSNHFHTLLNHERDQHKCKLENIFKLLHIIQVGSTINPMFMVMCLNGNKENKKVKKENKIK